MIVARPQKAGEPDLLVGQQRCALRFATLTGNQELEVHQPPKEGWTHDALDAVTLPKGEPWNAFLGTQWVGSSEI